MNEGNSQLPQLSPLVTICHVVPPSLTFNNSTFCPHTVFMCFVWISEQTAIISLYNINWLVFITETECVYCAVRTILSIIQVYSVRMRFRVDAVTLGQVILFPLSVAFHHCSLLIFIDMLLLWEGQTGEAWKPSKKQCFCGNLRALVKCLHVCNAWRFRQNVRGWQ